MAASGGGWLKQIVDRVINEQKGVDSTVSHGAEVLARNAWSGGSNPGKSGPIAPPGYVPGSYGKAPSTKENPGGFLKVSTGDTGFNWQHDPALVKQVQSFLNGHGYKVGVDGIAGPTTRAAVIAFSHGVKPEVFAQQLQRAAASASSNATPTSVSAVPPDMRPGANGGRTAPAGGGNGAGGSTGFSPVSALTGMVTALLKGGSPNHLLDPNSLSEAVAGPQTALAAQLQSQLDQFPDAKKQALANIENWYGQVKTAEGNAATNDQTMANTLSDAMKGNSAGIVSGLGGSAMAGSGQIAAMGANDANSMKAIGASDKQLSSDLAPIFALEEAGNKNLTSSKFDAGKTDIQNQLATALGQAGADKAAALMQIVDANNKTRQQNFSNEAGLLNTLASLQISGTNAATKAQSTAILNALRASEIQKNATKAVGGFDAATGAQKAKVSQNITQYLLDPNSPGHLRSGMDWPTALRSARNIVRTNGWDPLNPGVVKTIIGPALSMAGVQFQNPNVLFQP